MKLLFSLCFFFCTFMAFAQTSDKLYLQNETLDVKVEEVGIHTVKYRFPNEEATYVVSKNRVDKIVFGSGREEVFQSVIKEVNTMDDFDKVYITYIPEDVAGLESRGEVYAKATGVTALSSINNVKNRAVKKAKLEAAMLGANVIFVGNMFQRGNQYGSEETPANSTMTSISGTAYTSSPINAEEAIKYIRSNEFVYSHFMKLNRNAWDADIEPKTIPDENGNIDFRSFQDIQERDGRVYVKTDIKEAKRQELEVILAKDDKLILMERNGKTINNYLFITKNDPRIINAYQVLKLSQMK